MLSAEESLRGPETLAAPAGDITVCVCVSYVNQSCAEALVGTDEAAPRRSSVVWSVTICTSVCSKAVSRAVLNLHAQVQVAQKSETTQDEPTKERPPRARISDAARARDGGDEY